MKTLPIERMSSLSGAALADYFQAGPPHPCILTDAASAWPARTKWTFDFFATQFRDELGIATLSFDNTTSGKATKLGAFIDHLDEPLSAVPGFWVEPGGTLMPSEPAFDESLVWSFSWKPFKHHNSLREDISPWPSSVPNLVAGLPDDLYSVFESIYGVDFHSIYISRKNTLTRLHFDFHHTIGCLVQFVGSKRVVLFEPADYREVDGTQFDPENPDFERHPEMRDKRAFSSVLGEGEMLIIPPDWWHYTRSEDRSITLSHNFFNHVNFARYMRCVFEDICRHQGQPQFFERIDALLHPPSSQAPT